MKKIFPSCTVVLCMIFTVFYGCKKKEVQPLVEVDAEFKKVVQTWKKSYAETASIKDNSKADEIVSKLEYNFTKKIQLADKVLYLIRVKNDSRSYLSEYLGISVKDGITTFEGIHVGENLTVIANFLQTNRLAANKTVLIKLLDGFTQRGWRTDNSGHLYRGVGEYRQAYVPAKALVAASQKNKLITSNNFPPPGGVNNPCIYHYTIWYVVETGVILDISFDGMTGNCDITNGDNGGGGSSEDPVDPECSFTAEEAQQILAASHGYKVTDDRESSDATIGDEYTDYYGKIRTDYFPKSYKEFYRTSVFGVSVGYGIYYSGILYRNNAADLQWKFESMTYVGYKKTSGSLIPCSAMSVTIIDKTHEILFGGKKMRTNFSYSMQLSFNCVGDVALGDPDEDETYMEWIISEGLGG